MGTHFDISPDVARYSSPPSSFDLSYQCGDSDHFHDDDFDSSVDGIGAISPIPPNIPNTRFTSDYSFSLCDIELLRKLFLVLRTFSLDDESGRLLLTDDELWYLKEAGVLPTTSAQILSYIYLRKIRFAHLFSSNA